MQDRPFDKDYATVREWLSAECAHFMISVLPSMILPLRSLGLTMLAPDLDPRRYAGAQRPVYHPLDYSPGVGVRARRGLVIKQNGGISGTVGLESARPVLPLKMFCPNGIESDPTCAAGEVS